MGPGTTRKPNEICYFPNASTTDLRVSKSVLREENNIRTAFNHNQSATRQVPYSKKRAKSQILLNYKGEEIRRMPSHIMPELLYDLSRTGSHISLDLSESDEENQTSHTTHVSQPNVLPGQRMIVQPDVPRVIVLKTQLAPVKPKAHTKSEHSTPSKSASNVQFKWNGEVIDTRMKHKLPQNAFAIKGPYKVLNNTSSLPSRYQSRTTPRRIPLTTTLSEVQRGSVEDFMQDATMNLTRDEYDPYGLVRRNFHTWFSESAQNKTNSVSPDSRTSSGQFSLGSTQSVSYGWTLPRTLDRRKRRQVTTPNVNTILVGN